MSQTYPKITISLPAELLEQINEYRNEIKISETCREVLKARVESLSRSRNKVKQDMESIIDRLRKEKSVVDKRDYDLGFNTGYEEASMASYHDLMAAYNQYQSIGESFYDFAEGDGIVTFTPLWATWPKAAQAGNWLEYVRGWNDGLCKFWNDVKSKVNGIEE